MAEIKVNDRVQWNDPDNGTCSGVYTVTEIRTDEDTGEVVSYLLGDGTEALPNEVEQPEPVLIAVGLYLVDRAYGGPEEGGWYYDVGKLITDAEIYQQRPDALPRYFLNEDDAHTHCRSLNDKYRESLNHGRYSKSSVLSTGEYSFETHETTLPGFYPERKPHYE